jgi:hypothetical protein
MLRVFFELGNALHFIRVALVPPLQAGMLQFRGRQAAQHRWRVETRFDDGITGRPFVDGRVDGRHALGPPRSPAPPGRLPKAPNSNKSPSWPPGFLPPRAARRAGLRPCGYGAHRPAGYLGWRQAFLTRHVIAKHKSACPDTRHRVHDKPNSLI